MAKTSSKRFYAWVIWLLGALFMFYKYVIEVSPSVMTSSLMRDFHLDGTTLGHLAASYYYAYFIMQIPVGLLLDRFGPRNVTAIAIFLCGIGALIFSKVHSAFLAGTGRFVVGIGAAFAAISCLKLITHWFPHRLFAFMAGLMMTVGMLGAAGGVAPLAGFVSYLGWRKALFEISLFGIALSIIFWLIVRDQPTAKTENVNSTRNPFKGLKRALKNPQTWTLSIFGGFAFAPITAFGGLWGVSFISEAYALDRIFAGHLTSFIFIGFALGAPLTGLFSDYIGRRKPVIFWGVFISLLLMIAILFIKGLPLLLLGAFLFCLGFFMSSFLICFTILREITSKFIIATALAFMNSIQALFGAVTDPLTGFFLDFAWKGQMQQGVRFFSVKSYRFALSILVIYIIISLIFFCFVKETYCKEEHSPDSLV